MTIKSRLITSTAALLCLATVVIGTIAIGAVTSTMTDRVDDQLREYLRQPLSVLLPQASGPTARSSRDTAPAYQPVAVLGIDQAGEIIVVARAGYFSAPLHVPDLDRDDIDNNGISTISAADESVDYRVLLTDTSLSVSVDSSPPRPLDRLAIAAPLNEVTEVRGQLMTTMVVTVAAILALSVLGSWWITRRGLRPVDDMIDTAAAIAGGDLNRRAKSDRHSELGRLAGSLNSMVSKLVHALGEREAEQVRLRRFIADASHELRTPLSTVSGYTQLYKAGGAPPGPMLDRAMDRIDAENQRMSKLVNDLLLLARLDQNAVDVWQRCDLSRLTTDCAEDARTVDPDRTIETAVEPDVYVDGDESRLRQIVTNLLANVRQHTPEGTVVRVSVARQDMPGPNGPVPVAVLTVADDGPGIPEEHREKVFDRLYRVDPARSRATGGAGLGLAIVSAIVQSHGGTVQLDSTEGVGTTITIRLRLSPDDSGDED